MVHGGMPTHGLQDQRLPGLWNSQGLETLGLRIGTLRHCLGLASRVDFSSTALLFSSLQQNDSSSLNDVVLVSVDTEGESIREIGIATLDTRDLKNLTPTSDLSQIIKTHNYRIWKNEKLERNRAFRFGTSQRLEKQWIRWLLQKTLRTGSPDLATTEPRNTIIVGHSLGCDLGKMSRHGKGGLNINDLPKTLVLDTATLVPRKKVDSAVRSCDGHTLSTDQQNRATILASIAKLPLPLPPPYDIRSQLDEDLCVEPNASDGSTGDWAENCDGVLGLPVGIEDAMLCR
ncbi:hypothetical protein EG329_001878 [Mollisiaceae sp. DMI_Dod_QoI]|nr:hypothetical protein EG329_001878 [Helotiales sp. DMI_Dod_QoI]